MKRSTLTFSFLFCIFYTFYSQNLVPNPSFESYSCLPDGPSYLRCATDWFNPTNRTPDYMHRMSTDAKSDVPNNQWGSQEPHTGDAYLALHTWTSEREEIEFAQILLKEPLTVGQEYEVGCYISWADETHVFTNAHGFLLTEERITNGADCRRTIYAKELIRKCD